MPKNDFAKFENSSLPNVDFRWYILVYKGTLPI